MEQLNYSIARAVFSQVMERVLSGYPVEITRRGRESVVVISKATYDRYRKVDFERKCRTDSNG